jgi:hypothetical protein
MGLLLLLGSSGARSSYEILPFEVGYSLRRIKPSAPLAVRVRRDSDSAELDIGFSGNNLDTASLLSFCGAGNGFVTTWYDQSGNGRNATQTTAGSQPTIVASGALVTDPDNGRVAVRILDNSAAAIQQHLLQIGAWLSASSQYFSAFSLYTMTGTGDFASIFDLANDGTINRGAVSFHSASGLRFSFATNRTGGTTTFSPTTTTYGETTTYSRFDYADRSALKIWINENYLGAATDRNENFLSNNRIAVGNLFSPVVTSDIYLSELIFYAQNPSSVIGSLFAEQNNYWQNYTHSVYSLGDSTIAAYSGEPSVLSLVSTSRNKVIVAVPGDTIQNQLDDWNALDDQRNAFAVFVQTGLNDLDEPATSAGIISALQGLFDQIRTDCPFSKIIACTMTPARQRFINLYGAVNGVAAYNRWLAVNESIRGEGGSPITGVDRRISIHTDQLNDGSGNLKAEYDIGDGIHPNTAGRQVIANAYQSVLNTL